MATRNLCKQLLLRGSASPSASTIVRRALAEYRQVGADDEVVMLSGKRLFLRCTWDDSTSTDGVASFRVEEPGHRISTNSHLVVNLMG